MSKTRGAQRPQRRHTGLQRAGRRPRHTDLQHDWHPARRLPDRQTNHGSLAGHLRGGVGRVRTHAAEDQPSANRHFPSFAAVADAPISK